MPGAYASATVDFEYTIRRSDRARRVRVTVDVHHGVEVVLPRRAREREAAAAVAQLRPWIERRLAESAALRARIAARGATVPYLGRALALRVEPGRTRVHRAGDALLVPDGDPRPALERWYRRAARDEVGAAGRQRRRGAGRRAGRDLDPRPAHALGLVPRRAVR